MTLLGVSLILLAYLAGSMSSAIIICRIMRLPDPRTQGSGNPGATNVLRLGGKGAAAVTLAADILKGLLPVLLARLLTDGPVIPACSALAAFLGHLYPVFFQFRGGKGVATALGSVLGLAPLAALAMVLTWLAMAVTFRYSSLAALTAALLAPFYTFWLTGEPTYVIAIVAVSIITIWRHRSNLRRLVSGTEGKIGARS
jgi:glycerol-3-phosphate acyltransferase PlsY